MRGRLSLLMFLLYMVPGALLPLYSLRLQELGPATGRSADAGLAPVGAWFN